MQDVRCSQKKQRQLNQDNQMIKPELVVTEALYDANVGGFGHHWIVAAGWIALQQFPVIVHKALPCVIEADPAVPELTL